MEVLFHLIFTIVKIAILGSIYATLILLAFLIIGKIKPESWFAKVSKEKKQLWFSSGFVISILIIIYAFTYWGNHRLGDSARIPIGHWKSINQINGVWAYIDDLDYKAGQINIKEFAMTKDFLCAKTDISTVDEHPGKFVIWNLKTNEVEFYSTAEQYTEYARQNKLPMISNFKKFNEHYRDYWSGWRFWLLA